MQMKSIIPWICLLVCAGCGPSGPETAPVSGRVTFGGKPVAEGTVKFWSEAGGALAASPLDAEGNYSLKTHPDLKGATLGKHKVTIRSARTTFVPNPSGGEDLEKLIWLTPPRYDDRRTTPLTAEVKPGPNTIDFDLPSEPLHP